MKGVDQRRRFLKASAATLASAMLTAPLRAFDTADPASLASVAVAEKPVSHRHLFALNQVQLLDSDFSRAAAINLHYLHSLPVDRLARAFLVQAGKPTSAAPFGGWEKPDCELRGHFTGGHYLSACAIAWAAQGDGVLKTRGDELVGLLAGCQQTDGYLSAFPASFFDRLSRGEKVWAPFYTLHKIQAGMLDMYTLAGNRQALDVATGIGNWTVRWLNGFSDADIAHILKTEYGGMNESMVDLYAITGNGRYLDAAHRFDQALLFDPLAAHRDELKGLHSNTQIPKILGAARRYELTGEPRYRRIAEYFWETVTQNRSYATGGSSNEEFWRTEPGDLKGQLGLYAAESCVAYNLLKLTKHIYAWNGDPRAFDYYERNLYNARLGSQDAQGMKLYYYSLQPGGTKFFNSPNDSFWCCTGSGAEEFARFNDAIYAHGDNELFVNLYIASSLHWPEQGLTMAQRTTFPHEAGSAFEFTLDQPREMAVNLRIPSWIAPGAAVTMNGTPLDVFASPGSYLTIKRRWQTGDRVTITLPMRVHAVPLPGDDSLQAMMIGPLVLAARLGSKGLTHDQQYGKYDAGPSPEPKPQPAPRVAMDAPGELQWLKPGNDPLSFRANTRDGELAVIPLNQIQSERYAVYWQADMAADGAS